MIQYISVLLVRQNDAPYYDYRINKTEHINDAVDKKIYRILLLLCYQAVPDLYFYYAIFFTEFILSFSFS